MLQNKAAVAQKYFELEESLLAGRHISFLSLAKTSYVSWGFSKKIVEEIESDLLIYPATKAWGWICSDGASTLMDGDRLLE